MTPRGRVVDATLTVGTVVLAVLAARADLDAPEVQHWQVVADLVVGVAFIVAGRLSPVPVPGRVLLVGVGASWLLASFALDARLWHQAVLAVALVTFPTGRVGSFGSRGVVAAAAIAALLVVPQGLVALLFALVVVVVTLEPRDRGAAQAYPVIAAASVGAVLYWSWHTARTAPESFDPVVALTVYEGVLLIVAAAAPLAARAVLDRRSRLVDGFLGDQRLLGMEGLEAVLRDALDDPAVSVHRWQIDERRFVGADGSHRDGPEPGRRWVPVAEDGATLAVVELASSAVDDEATTTALTSAVGLALANLALQDELDAQLVALEAARERLVAAGDRQRETTAARLRLEVLEPLGGAANDLRTLADNVRDPAAGEALAVVVDELTAAVTEIGDHVFGVPATYLGAGRLVEAVESLADRCALPVVVDAPAGWAAHSAAETTLFYVCSEALTNVVKHARGSSVSIVLGRSDGEVSVRVADDGVGGADPRGSGLQGVADRVAARGGRLEVESPPGAGTTLTATVPG